MRFADHDPVSFPGRRIAPGLATVELATGAWVIVHERSGAGILQATNAEGAAAMALDLASSGIDWELPGDEIPLACDGVLARCYQRHKTHGAGLIEGRTAQPHELGDISGASE